MFRPNYLETFVFEDKQSFAELLISDLDSEVEMLYKGIANIKERVSGHMLQIDALKPFVPEPLAYKKKQIELARKTLRKSKTIQEKNAELLIITTNKLDFFSTKEEKEKLIDQLGFYGHQALILLLKQYKSTLIDRDKELEKNISTLEKDIEVFSKLDEKKQADDLQNKIIIQTKLAEKEQDTIQQNKLNIKELTGLQQWLRENF